MTQTAIFIPRLDDDSFFESTRLVDKSEAVRAEADEKPEKTINIAEDIAKVFSKFPTPENVGDQQAPSTVDSEAENKSSSPKEK